MFECSLVLILCFVISPAVSSVAKERISACRNDEFNCSDGKCISYNAVCDGIRDCSDSSDEALCTPGASLNGQSEDLILHRFRRQTSQCRKNQWRCRDGSCISFDGKCDGVVDCPDKSDETFPLCRKSICQPNWFRCTYGACVDGTAPCNNIVECADESDELMPKCRNETDEAQGRFRCQDGSYIPASDHCDGIPNCPDGSDETVRACAAKTCPSYLFQCAYGACVDQGSDCNGQKDCADGSDESDELCNRMLPNPTTVPVTRPEPGKCVLPPYPDHGTYTVSNMPYAIPGQSFQALVLTVTCRPGYGVTESAPVFCQGGSWSNEIPKCVRLCKLDKNPSVTYICLVYGAVVGQRECKPYEPSGTTVRPECNKPNYHSSVTLPNMNCVDGSWDYVAVCTPECGRVTPEGVDLIIDGTNAKRGELPWFVGIYRKTTHPYEQICGGSLVSNKVVISAAHCFWDDVIKKQPASNYAVAVGKIYRPYDNKVDKDAQKSDVKEIKIPARFQGATANFQDDIALLIVQVAFEYKTYVRPICLDFDVNFDRRQLRQGSMGKVAGFGLTAVNGKASQVLKVVELPYVNIEDCFNSAPPGFREYITSDKICAGYNNGTGKALCKGDSGGGLGFPESERGTERYYLRGIVSTAPNNENLCNANTFSTFTQILKHEHFIKEHLLN